MKKYAIATCRVSSIEQLDSNSLNRQAKSVNEAAKYLGATIPSDGIWSGSVSSKEGRNYSRKDLRAMLEYCKKNPRVEYLIVDEIDRFMRSIDEMFYFEVEFRNKVGVKVWYAGDPALNSDDPLTKLRRAMEAFKAEGSNLERQLKSIKGQVAAIEDGRWPFSPKPGYKRGYDRGIQEVHPKRGQPLRSILIKIASGLLTPSQGLIELNKSDFMSDGHAPYKMDKFRKIVTDPFYAGILIMDKQVKARNDYGMHEKLITKEQHLALIKIMDNKKKTQSGPRKNGNPDYPLSNHVSCDLCKDKKNGRYVGFDHGNGSSPRLVYNKYRCRACKRYLKREDLHPQVVRLFKDRPVSDEGVSDIVEAIKTVWSQKEDQAIQDANYIRHKISSLNKAIVAQVEAATDPSNNAIKAEILESIAKKKNEVAESEEELATMNSNGDRDLERFLRFAFDFIDNMGSRFLEINPENRLRCKLIVFPAGFYLDANNKVYTPEISPLYGLATKKKSAEALDNSHLVRLLQNYSKHCMATKTLVAVRIRAESEHRKTEAGRRVPASAVQLRPGQVDELVRLYGELKSVKGLARQLGIHHHTVRKHLVDRGVVIAQPRRMSTEELALARRLYVDEQLTAAQIAPKIGFTASTIAKALNRAGVKMRPQVARG